MILKVQFIKLLFTFTLNTNEYMDTKEFLLTTILKVYQETLANQNMPDKKKALLNEFISTILQPVVNPKDLDVTYATIKYWEKKQYLLLPVIKEVGEWRKFSILEFLWIQILKKAAEMGCSLDVFVPKLLFAYENCKSPNQIIDYTVSSIDTAHFNKAEVRSVVVSGFLTQITGISIGKAKTSIHLYVDSCQFITESNINKNTVINDAYTAVHKSGVGICISDIVFENIQNEKYSFAAPQVFNKSEIKILSLLKKNELKEITIKLEDGKPVTMELKEKFSINKDDTSKRLKDFFSSNYQEISAVTNGGKTIFFERITKQKLN